MRKLAKFIANDPTIIHCTIICVLVSVLFIIDAPLGGSFPWADSARHALNGVFVMDLLSDLPFDDPVAYAYNYYSQYPALSILFYPPLYSFILAAFYALLGVSHETAMFAEFFTFCFFAVGVYFFSRFWLSSFASLGVAIIISAVPEVAFWGRQIMLEIPVFAFVIWSAYFLIRYVRSGRISSFYLSIALLVLAAYVKTPIVFLVLPYLICIFQYRGPALFKDKHSYIILALAIVATLPLVVITLKFGQLNLQSAVSTPDSNGQLTLIENLVWYAGKFPVLFGWPTLIAILFSLVLFGLFAIGKKKLILDNLFLISWFVVGYLFYTAIDIKYVRFSIPIILPPIVLIGYAGDLLENKKQWVGKLFITIVALATFLTTYLYRPVDYVFGYDEIAEFVSSRAPENSNILFSGYRDGVFIFHMRAYSNRPDVSIIRSEKLLLKITHRRSVGVEQKQYSVQEISDLINSLAINYVVAQTDYYTDLEQMALFQNLLQSDQFEVLKKFYPRMNMDDADKEIIIYKNLGNVATGPVEIINEIPLAGITITNTKP